MLLLSFAVAAFVLETAAFPASYVVHESRDASAVHSRWLKKGRVPPDVVLPMRIGLTQRNLEKGPEYLMAVADPSSPSYGKHWTSEEVIEAFQPSDKTIRAVTNWLKNAGIYNVSLSGNKGFLAFNRPAAQVEALLHAEYYLYEDKHTGIFLPSCDLYYIPKRIQDHIDYITPGLKLLAPRPRSRKKAQIMEQRMVSRLEHDPRSIAPLENENLHNCDWIITPACLAALYKIPPSTLRPHPGNRLGIYESQAGRWDQTDLNIFFDNFTNGRIPKGTTPLNYAIDGGQSKALHEFVHEWDGTEPMLDLDMAYPIVYPQGIGVWDENDHHYQRQWIHNDTLTWGFNQLLDAIDGSYCTYSAYGETGDAPGIDPTYPDPGPHGYNHPLECGVFKPPNVISFSYSGQEHDVPMAYQARQCNEYLKLGLQGVSFLFASGDTGVGDSPVWAAGDTKTGCLGSNSNYRVFNPAWPNTCPWVINVGATKVYRGNSVNESQPESAVFDPDSRVELSFASGGGFSNLYPVPEYQRAAVEYYLTNHDPPYPYYSQLAEIKPNPAKININDLQGNTNGLYNRIGRGYPDVSANGDNGAVVLHGMLQREGGTSQSTPIFSAILNRINEERIAVGKSTVGFVNPVLYKNPSVLNDVTNGSNPGCFTKGFQTAPGWDPATGLGTPDYPKMLELFMSLP